MAMVISKEKPKDTTNAFINLARKKKQKKEEKLTKNKEN